VLLLLQAGDSPLSLFLQFASLLLCSRSHCHCRSPALRLRCAMQWAHEKEIDNCKVSIFTTMSAQFASIEIFYWRSLLCCCSQPPIQRLVALSRDRSNSNMCLTNAESRKADQCALDVCVYICLICMVCHLHTYMYIRMYVSAIAMVRWRWHRRNLHPHCWSCCWFLFILPCAQIVWLLSMPAVVCVVSLSLCASSRFRFDISRSSSSSKNYNFTTTCKEYTHMYIDVYAWVKCKVRWGKVCVPLRRRHCRCYKV